MERITFKGNFCDISMCRENPCPYNGMCSQRQTWERLKEYEDTGLEPEEIKDMGLEVATMNTIESMYDGLGNPDHLRDLLQAEQDGRLVVLPCKVGDTVYKLWYEPCHNGEDYPDSYGCCGCEDECDLKRSIFNFKVPSVDWILSHLNSFGDVVWYLTREEAEAALAQEGGTDEDSGGL